MSNLSPAGAGWEPDPTGRHQLRYWDGNDWTEHVSDAGDTTADPAGRPAPGSLPPPVPVAPPPGSGSWSAPGGEEPAPMPGFGAPPAYGSAVGQSPGYGQTPPGSGQLPPPYGQPLPYGYAPVSVAQPLNGLATALTVLLIVTAVAGGALALALFNRAAVLEDPFGATFDEVQGADDAAAGTAGVFLLGLLATGVVWVIWQHKHAKNARVLGQTEGLTPGWAIGGWFIPIGNWFLPQLQLKQAAEASDPTGAGKAPPVLIVWWVLWVVGSLAGYATRNNDLDETASLDDIESFRTADQVAGASMLLVIAAAVAAIILVRSLSTRQQQSLAARGIRV